MLRAQVNDFLSVWFDMSVLWRVLCEFVRNYSVSNSKFCILKFHTNVYSKFKDSGDDRKWMYLREER